jgi:Flp pilus assembly protein TadB
MRPIVYVWIFLAIAILLTAFDVFGGTVVLPERFANDTVISKNSAAYKALVAKTQQIADQLNREQQARADFEKRVDEDLQTKQDRLEKLEAEHAAANAAKGKSIFGTVLSIAGMALGFISNPFGWIVTRLIGIALALVVGFVIFILLRRAYRHFRNKKSTEHPFIK